MAASETIWSSESLGYLRDGRSGSTLTATTLLPSFLSAAVIHWAPSSLLILILTMSRPYGPRRFGAVRRTVVRP